MCRSFFYAVLTYCALPITVTAHSWSKNEHFSLYREKAREEKEGKHRLWERCVNRLRFSAVSIAAAREKREGGFFAQAACRRSFALPFLPEYQGLFCIIVRRNRAKVLLYPFIKVKAHGFCIGNPEPAHPVTLAGNPVLAGDSAKRVSRFLLEIVTTPFCSPLGLENLKPFGSLLLQERIANTLAFASSRHKTKAG